MWPLYSIIAITFLLCHELASTPVKGGCRWEVSVSRLEGEVLQDLCSLSPRHDLSLVFSCRNTHRSVCIQPIKSLDVEACEKDSQSATAPVVITGTSHKAFDIDLALVINVDGELEAVDTFHIYEEMSTGSGAGPLLFNAIGKHKKTRIQINLRPVCTQKGMEPLERNRREKKLSTQTADAVTVKMETSSVGEELSKDDVIFSGEGEQSQTSPDETLQELDDLTKEFLPSIVELDKEPVREKMKKLPITNVERKTHSKDIAVAGFAGINIESSQKAKNKSELGDVQIAIGEDGTKKRVKDDTTDSKTTPLKGISSGNREDDMKEGSVSLAVNENLLHSSKLKQVSEPVRVERIPALKETQEQQSTSLDALVQESLDKLQIQMKNVKQNREQLSSTSVNQLTTSSMNQQSKKINKSQSTATPVVTSSINNFTTQTSKKKDEQTTQKTDKQTAEDRNEPTVAASLVPSPLASTSSPSPQDDASTIGDYVEDDLTSPQEPHSSSQPFTSPSENTVTSTERPVNEDPVDKNGEVFSAKVGEPLIAMADEDTPRGVKEITDQDFLEKLMQSLRNQSNVDEDLGPQTPLSFSKPTVPTTSALSPQSTVQPVQPRDIWFGRNNSNLIRNGEDSASGGSTISTTEPQTEKDLTSTTRSTSTGDKNVVSSATENESSLTDSSTVTTTATTSKEDTTTPDPTTTTTKIFDRTNKSTEHATEVKDTDDTTIPTSQSSSNTTPALTEKTSASQDTTRSSSALKITRTTLQDDSPTSTDENPSDTTNNTTTEPMSQKPTTTEYVSTQSSTATTTKTTSKPSSLSTRSTTSASTSSPSTSSTRTPTSTDSAPSNEPSISAESTSDTTQSSTTSIHNSTEAVKEASSSISSHSESPDITTIDEHIAGHTPGPLLATSSEAKRRRFSGETGDEEEFWPIVAGLVIGIPSIIVFGIAITVIHKRRKIDTSRAFYLGGHHHRHSIDV